LEIYLVRHAVAHDRDPERWPDDSQRPLTPEGEEKFVRAARGLRELVPGVELVLSSPFERAWRTAEILHEEAGWPAPRELVELQSGAPPEETVRALGEYADYASLALVGHEPHLSELASYLISGGEDSLLRFKKGGVARVSMNGPYEPGVLRWLLPPKVLRSIG
jgi:phosphohistidine phosphatase